MVLSKYNFFKDEFASGKGGFAYNVRTGSILGIPDESDWKALLESKFDKLDSETVELLNENGVIVESLESEFEDIKRRRHAAITGSAALCITVLPTDSCNFACPYCFVYEKKQNFMKDSTYGEILQMIKSKMAGTEKPEVVYLNWYGGEPSLCSDKIIAFMNELNAAGKEAGIAILGSMTTNGYLVDRAMFEKFIAAGITSVQVTVDGVKEAHDAFRFLKNGGATYEKIMSNLLDIARIPETTEFSLDVRCNFTKATVGQVGEFTDVFARHFGSDRRFKLYCRPVYHYETKSNDIDSIRADLFSLSEGLEMQHKLAVKIEKETSGSFARRLVDPLPQPINLWCNAEMNNHAIIGPLGQIYICDTLTSDENTQGHARDFAHGGEWPSVRYDIFSDPRTEKCVGCKLLPLCMGNCMRNRLHNEAQCYWTVESIEKSINDYIRNYGERQDPVLEYAEN